MDIPILAPGQPRVETIDGAEYRLYALTYREVSEIQIAVAGMPQPSQAVVLDAMKTACERAERADLARALDEFEDAQDAMGALYADIPSDADPEGRDRWMAENRDALRGINLAMAKAGKRRDVAIYVASQDAAVKRVREELARFSQADTIAMVAAGLRQPEDDVRDLPAHHVAHLAGALRRMINPTVSAAKN